VQVHQLFAGRAAVDGRTVDELQCEIGCRPHELGDLADVGLFALHRLRVTLPEADDVVGEDVAGSSEVRRGPEGRPQLGAELRLGLALSHGPSLRRLRLALNYVTGNDDCDPVDLSAAWHRLG
jgi:hypothetical protein